MLGYTREARGSAMARITKARSGPGFLDLSWLRTTGFMQMLLPRSHFSETSPHTCARPASDKSAKSWMRMHRSNPEAVSRRLGVLRKS